MPAGLAQRTLGARIVHEALEQPVEPVIEVADLLEAYDVLRRMVSWLRAPLDR